MDATPKPPVRRRTLLTAAGAAVVTASGTAAARAAAPQPSALTPLQLAGQRVIYSYPGLTPPAALLTAIRAGQAAGVIFFGENISSESQIASVVSQLAQANAAAPVNAPLLLMTDQEGGQVRRLPGAPTLSEKQIGLSGQSQIDASRAGAGAGQNLAGVGMNLNLAPVLDVFYQSGNFIDEYQRSYSSDPARVSSLGRAFIAAQQTNQVAATAKHFPGLGAATAAQNTDLGPVTLTQSLTTLRNTDEAPYRTAIAAGVKLVMLSWAVYPALDASRPAGLSPVVVQQELRQRLGFTGVTITDALEAGAISSSYTTGRRAVLAATAGIDLLLCSARDTSQGAAAVTALADAYSSAQLPTADFNAAVQRVTALRTWLA
ncbi:glycoside hydrolase family 3 N-terminal domain-containing protein [Streptomyces sp. CA-111067]|uniref:glycoside hydrolase family 3 N-terminal domain-containing protein n=1 Tax=Streptomyces sp. CA-111067 TaxID=3240046 RepID=UPI003D98CC2E